MDQDQASPRTADRPGTAAAVLGDKVHGSVVRQRATALRDIAIGLSRRFRQSQTGTVRPGLTLDDGTLVVTDNFLKVRIDPGLPRNQRVQVRLLDELRGEVIPGRRTANRAR